MRFPGRRAPIGALIFCAVLQVPIKRVLQKRLTLCVRALGLCCRNPSPEGAAELSPALQRWGEVGRSSKSRRDDRVI